MFCLKCGQKINDDAQYCPYCNSPTENEESVKASIQPTSNKASIPLGIVATVLGGNGLIFAWVLAILGWLLGGAALTLSIIGKAKNSKSAICTIGMIFAIVTLAFSFINSVLGAILALS